MREQIARGKAFGALGLGIPSRDITEMVEKRPHFGASTFAASQGRVIPSPGGVLVVGKKGSVIGAVGVSGDLGDEDESVVRSFTCACAFAVHACVHAFVPMCGCTCRAVQRLTQQKQRTQSISAISKAGLTPAPYRRQSKL